MVEARRHDSQTKRARVLAVLEQMLQHGTPITFASAARQAKVSAWLVYAPGVREAIEDARARQHLQGSPDHRTSRDPPGATTDLALARAEITRLRAERDTQRQQLGLALGARMDNIAKADLLTRVDELTRHNNELAANLSQCRSEGTVMVARIAELEDDLAAARTSLRRMVRAENLPAAITTPKGERP